MELTIKIDLDNAAFEDGGADEVARILADLAQRLPDPLEPTRQEIGLRDANGNHVGTARIGGGGADLMDAVNECLPDLEHYASSHGPGPDRRLDALKGALRNATA